MGIIDLVWPSPTKIFFYILWREEDPSSHLAQPFRRRILVEDLQHILHQGCLPHRVLVGRSERELSKLIVRDGSQLDRIVHRNHLVRWAARH